MSFDHNFLSNPPPETREKAGAGCEPACARVFSQVTEHGRVRDPRLIPGTKRDGRAKGREAGGREVRQGGRETDGCRVGERRARGAREDQAS